MVEFVWQNSKPTSPFLYINYRHTMYITYVFVGGMLTIWPYTKFSIPNSEGLWVFLSKLRCRLNFHFAMLLSHMKANIHIYPPPTNTIFRHQSKWRFWNSHFASSSVRHVFITDRRKLWRKHALTTAWSDIIFLLSFVRKEARDENFKFGEKDLK